MSCHTAHNQSILAPRQVVGASLSKPHSYMEDSTVVHTSLQVLSNAKIFPDVPYSVNHAMNNETAKIMVAPY